MPDFPNLLSACCPFILIPVDLFRCILSTKILGPTKGINLSQYRQTWAHSDWLTMWYYIPLPSPPSKQSPLPLTKSIIHYVRLSGNNGHFFILRLIEQLKYIGKCRNADTRDIFLQITVFALERKEIFRTDKKVGKVSMHGIGGPEAESIDSHRRTVPGGMTVFDPPSLLRPAAPFTSCNASY